MLDAMLARSFASLAMPPAIKIEEASGRLALLYRRIAARQEMPTGHSTRSALPARCYRPSASAAVRTGTASRASARPRRSCCATSAPALPLRRTGLRTSALSVAVCAAGCSKASASAVFMGCHAATASKSSYSCCRSGWPASARPTPSGTLDRLRHVLRRRRPHGYPDAVPLSMSGASAADEPEPLAPANAGGRGSETRHPHVRAHRNADRRALPDEPASRS